MWKCKQGSLEREKKNNLCIRIHFYFLFGFGFFVTSHMQFVLLLIHKCKCSGFRQEIEMPAYFCCSCSKGIQMAVLLKFCSEGDNIPDAFALVNYLNEWLQLIKSEVSAVWSRYLAFVFPICNFHFSSVQHMKNVTQLNFRKVKNVWVGFILAFGHQVYAKLKIRFGLKSHWEFPHLKSQT